LDKTQQTKSLIAIKKFETGLHDKQLKVHKLTGKYKDEWAFSVEYNLRIIYSIVNR
jgi:mRNA-degrading endonuclease YafQ of YafQ-DinJ toxin-antitoxin module